MSVTASSGSGSVRRYWNVLPARHLCVQRASDAGQIPNPTSIGRIQVTQIDADALRIWRLTHVQYDRAREHQSKQVTPSSLASQPRAHEPVQSCVLKAYTRARSTVSYGCTCRPWALGRQENSQGVTPLHLATCLCETRAFVGGLDRSGPWVDP